TKDVLGYGQHGSTFGGNPVCAAGACSIISRIDDELLCSVKEKSEYIKRFLSGVKGVKSVSGLGLMLGIETEKSAKDIVNNCIEKGVLVLTAKTKIRLLPALNIPMEQLQKAMNILKEVIEE
ncbi:MAG: aminotransferase class III-fold pyridoxal phosphate-dependent enzyme, partial [Clostridia bacterium]|nr:aminotransferase class III-fold pyridoxal phosphate-dependent enzyme [Clostridia bacterium]